MNKEKCFDVPFGKSTHTQTKRAEAFLKLLLIQVTNWTCGTGYHKQHNTCEVTHRGHRYSAGTLKPKKSSCSTCPCLRNAT